MIIFLFFSEVQCSEVQLSREGEKTMMYRQILSKICSMNQNLILSKIRRRDTQHNDIQHNNIQHNGTHHNDTQPNKMDTQHNDIHYNTN